MDWIIVLLPIAFILWLLYILGSIFETSKSNGEKLDKILLLLKKDNIDSE